MEKLDLWFAPSKAFVAPPHLKAGAINEEQLLTFGSPLGCVPLCCAAW